MSRWAIAAWGQPHLGFRQRELPAALTPACPLEGDLGQTGVGLGYLFHEARSCDGAIGEAFGGLGGLVKAIREILAPGAPSLHAARQRE